MFSMIFKMTGVTVLYVLLTILIWKRTHGKPVTMTVRIAIGLIYGLCAILSTHFGVNYEHMMLNVRDMGPLSAGLFFDPAAGIIAGLIGGVERYIAGTYWGVGSYTRIACSVSTCLAGFVAAGMNIFLFKRKKPSAVYALFMGAVMEVFHMYVVFITHREDMNMAFYVVRTSAPPMIVFTGLGMIASSIALLICAGEWRNPFGKRQKEKTPVSERFQSWLFFVTASILILNQIFSFSVQTQTSRQGAQNTLYTISGDIRRTYEKLNQTEENTCALAGERLRMETQAIADIIEHSESARDSGDSFLDRMRSIFNLVAVTIVDREGDAITGSGESPVYSGLLSEVLEGSEESKAVTLSSTRVAAGARCGDGMVQAVVDKDQFAGPLHFDELNELLSYFHVGSSGTFDIIRDSGVITVGDHKDARLSQEDRRRMESHPEDTCFEERMFGERSFCLYDRLDSSTMLLVRLPRTEVYADRAVQSYESVFAAIILFAVLYVLISLLVQGIVVNDLELVNASLGRITQGNLNEVVSVRNSSEFASLSDDINQTVDVLKGYIAAAEKRIEQELEFARSIQESVLPKNFNLPRDDVEIYALMNPAKEVGGDFYDFFFVDQDKLALVIADVSGKGIPAAMFMMRAKTAIRQLTETGSSPSEVLYRANGILCEGNDAEMFVTVWLGIIDLITGKMQCANAGHEYPVLRHPGEDYEYIRDKHGLPLGVMEGIIYKGYELQVEKGDRLFVYTDGVPEAINTAEEQYGPDRLLQVLNTVRDDALMDALPAVRRDIASFVGGAGQFDDITLLGFVYRGEQL